MVPGMIPHSLQPLWKDLDEETVWLSGRWHVYRDLFLSNDRRVDLLNVVDGTFFAVVQAMLVEYFIVAISRLTDPPATKSQQNAVLGRLVLDPAIQANPELLSDLEDRLAHLANVLAPVRKVRNKRIAHRDLSIALKSGATPLPEITASLLEDGVTAIGAIMNAVSTAFTGTSTLLSDGVWSMDAGGLIAALKAGQYCDQAMEEGVLPWDFLEKAPYRDA